MILSTDLERKRGENKKRQRQFLNLWRLFLSFLFEYNEGAYFITRTKNLHILYKKKEFLTRILTINQKEDTYILCLAC